MPPKSAVERSEHRDEIDDLLLDGRSPRFVSAYLKNEYNESISHTAINNYKKKHLDVTKEAIIDYTNKKSKEGKEVQSQKNREKKKEKVVKKISSDLEKLDEIIEDSFNTKIDLERLVGDPDCDQVKVEGLKLKMRQQGISAVNAKTNILKQEDPTVEVNVNKDVTVNLLNKVKEKRRELNDLNNKGRDI
nr:hypothetical protein [uncultured Methanobrevibacter sp.]